MRHGRPTWPSAPTWKRLWPRCRPANWPSALGRISERIGSRSTLLVQINPRRRKASFSTGTGLSAEAIRTYANQLAIQDPFVQLCRARFPTGTAVADAAEVRGCRPGPRTDVLTIDHEVQRRVVQEEQRPGLAVGVDGGFHPGRTGVGVDPDQREPIHRELGLPGDRHPPCQRLHLGLGGIGEV